MAGRHVRVYEVAMPSLQHTLLHQLTTAVWEDAHLQWYSRIHGCLIHNFATFAQCSSHAIHYLPAVLFIRWHSLRLVALQTSVTANLVSDS